MRKERRERVRVVRVCKTYLISDCLMGSLVCDILRQVCTMTNFLPSLLSCSLLQLKQQPPLALCSVLIIQPYGVACHCHCYFYFNHLESVFISYTPDTRFRCAHKCIVYIYLIFGNLFGENDALNSVDHAHNFWPSFLLKFID